MIWNLVQCLWLQYTTRINGRDFPWIDVKMESTENGWLPMATDDLSLYEIAARARSGKPRKQRQRSRRRRLLTWTRLPPPFPLPQPPSADETRLTRHITYSSLQAHIKSTPTEREGRRKKKKIEGTCSTTILTSFRQSGSFARWSSLGLLDVLREPFEAVAVAHLADDAAHEDLQWADIGVHEVDFALSSSEVAQAQVIAELVLRGRIGDVDLVPQDEEGDVGQGVIRKEGVQLLLRLGKPLLVEGVHKINDCIHLKRERENNKHWTDRNLTQNSIKDNLLCRQRKLFLDDGLSWGWLLKGIAHR